MTTTTFDYNGKTYTVTGTYDAILAWAGELEEDWRLESLTCEGADAFDLLEDGDFEEAAFEALKNSAVAEELAVQAAQLHADYCGE